MKGEGAVLDVSERKKYVAVDMSGVKNGSHTVRRNAPLLLFMVCEPLTRTAAPPYHHPPPPPHITTLQGLHGALCPRWGFGEVDTPSPHPPSQRKGKQKLKKKAKLNRIEIKRMIED
ncbi:hypothetical protein Pcinc_024429 [Petrolisthes cinctipes]|uniref:Uncharacterized protein n=1 Tax=Petrolisthes cinctipes TaxID=88211 RepID=A0AAE1F9Y4_PETCI|nr:hypothetical protein Pcinc_024429 [Petrolisthes cinctipes]